MTDTSTQQAASPFLVAALYHFVSVPHFESLRAPLQQLCEDNGVKGTLLLAHEGINGTIAGPDAGIATVLPICAPCRNLRASSTRKAAPRRCPSCA
jgi:UPF0176 protein